MEINTFCHRMMWMNLFIGIKVKQLKKAKLLKADAEKKLQALAAVFILILSLYLRYQFYHILY